MKLGKFLLQNHERIVQNINIQCVEWDPTYGARVDTRSVEIINFDALCQAIDEFSETFK